MADVCKTEAGVWPVMCCHYRERSPATPHRIVMEQCCRTVNCVTSTGTVQTETPWPSPMCRDERSLGASHLSRPQFLPLQQRGKSTCRGLWLGLSKGTRCQLWGPRQLVCGRGDDPHAAGFQSPRLTPSFCPVRGAPESHSPGLDGVFLSMTVFGSLRSLFCKEDKHTYLAGLF